MITAIAILTLLGLTLGTAIWLFGVNTAGYLVECVAGHRHAHTWL